MSEELEREIRAKDHQIFQMSNTIEALKRRCVELEFSIVDHMAASIAHEAEGILREAASELPDGDAERPTGE